MLLALKNKKQKNLKNFLKKLNKWKIYNCLLKRSNGSINIESLNNGYFESFEYFRQRFFIEKRRAERKGYEFSLIVIDLNSDEKKVQQNENNALLNEAENVLFTTLKMTLRSTDVIIKIPPYRLVILLPDTDQIGKELVIQRINDTLKEILKQSLGDSFKNIKIWSFSYPLHEDEINNLVNNKIINQKTSTIALEKTIRGTKSCYFQIKNSNELSTNPKIKAISKNILALENPFCLLNEVFFDFSWNWQKVIKRYLDIVISLLALAFLLPMILLFSILIKITSSGPIFFKQKRIGYMGKEFSIYKFRTMYKVKDEQIHKEYVKNFINNTNHSESNSEKDNRIYKITNDPRVTPVGKLLRRTSLDEIVQFINVLKGDMSLVGPRPPIPYEVAMYDLWHKRRFLTVKPGITGLWQIYGRNTTTFNDMVRLDLTYANNWSLALDFKILFKTIWAVLSMKGAY